MGILNKGSSLSAAIAYTLCASAPTHIPVVNGIYDMRPKNSFRGGSRGKGGKIKYARR